MSLKTFAMQNVYAQNEGNYKNLYIPEKIEEFTLIDSAGGVNDEASLSFVNILPAHVPRMTRLKVLRGNKVSKRHCSIMSRLAQNLSRYYLITGRELKDRPFSPSSHSGDGSNTNTPHSMHAANIRSPSTNGATPYSQMDHGSPESYHRSGSQFSINVTGHSSTNDAPVVALGPMYIETITSTYGTTLTHLLLLPQWKLSTETLSHLVRSCPHLIQFGCALEQREFSTLQSIIPFLPRLYALRLLDSPEAWGLGDAAVGSDDEWQEERIGSEIWSKDRDSMRWLGIGELVFEVVKGAQVKVEVDGESRPAKVVRRVPLQRVKDVDVWSQDRLEI